jgi:AcrR family transcriptional regulator
MVATPFLERTPRPFNMGPIGLNKHGQALGRKGNKTRQRLMDATRRLLKKHSPVELTAVAVAKEARTSPATFYIYFKDVRDIIYHLSLLAGDEMTAVHRILEERRNPGHRELDHALRVVNAFNSVWERHRDVLRFRNLEADRGDKDFYELRLASAVPIINRFADRILMAWPKGNALSRGDAMAQAISLVCAMEAIAETDPIHVNEGGLGIERLSEATARLIARSMEGAGSSPEPTVERCGSRPSPRQLVAA